MGHIANRIIDLALVQRAAAPVGKARALVQRMAEPQRDEILISHLLALTQRHGGHLRVEHRVRRIAGMIVDNLHILPAGMEDFQHVFIMDQQIPERFEVDTFGQRIDRRGLLVVRDLHQAEQRIIGILAHELGVDGDEVCGGQAFAQFGERGGLRD